eukprot:GFUD01040509.1.p1 GENE.GFUD01040509.1~~GFUD01040509.1.p1  ORF type:complete len:368 (+),score=158.64 GFUD01040509.1:72-1106(+)
MSSTWLSKLSRLVTASISKLQEDDQTEYGPLLKEYMTLEQVGPTPGNPWDQHDAMVRMGMCQAAVKHKEKNRYCNLFPYDTNRVVLEGETDYINASWVTLPGVKDKLILTMGPLHPHSYSKDRRTDWDTEQSDNTCPQMWSMVAQQEVHMIVMLCAVQEGFTGCSQYFPPQVGEEQVHGGLKVVNKGEQDRGDGNMVRQLDLGTVGENMVQKVVHMQFTMWPNYGVVENVEQLASFVREVYKEARKGEGGPVVVHCSGGVGRSGTFTTLYSIYSMLVDSKHTGVWTEMEKYLGKDGELVLEPLVRRLRETRHPWMVEGEQQYRLAYQGCVQLARGVLEEEGVER